MTQEPRAPVSEVVRVSAPTEGRNPRTLDIDTLPTLELLRRINAEDRRVPEAVAAVLPALAVAVDGAAARYRAGGRIHYFGAGTSGRIAVLDAVELWPTFSVSPERFVAHLAGGAEAMVRSREGSEDDADSGAADAADVRAGDVAVGLAASGRTPYVRGAMRAARAAGALTIAVTANPDAPLAADVHHHIGCDTGPEVIAGSTRLKAGTAQKLVLNAFSTALMVRAGKTYSNLMVDVVATNAKLRGRVITMLVEASGEDEHACVAALAAADGDTKTALVTLLAGVDPTTARAALQRSDGVVRAALGVLAVRDGQDPPATPPAAARRPDEEPT